MQFANQMNRLLLILFFLIPCLVFPKVNSYQFKIDSILVKLHESRSDSEQISSYADLFYYFEFYHTDGALEYIDTAIAIAKRNIQKPYAANLFFYTGRIFWKLGKYDLAIQHHKYAYEYFKDKKEYVNLKINALRYIGQDYADGGKYNESLMYFKQALDLDKELGNKDEMANTYLLLSWVYNNLGNTIKSTEMNFEALHLYEELRENYGIALAKSNLASDNELLGNYEEAVRYYLEAIRPQLEVRDYANLGLTYSSIGNVYTKLGNYNKAIEFHQRAILTSRITNDHGSLAKSQLGIGNVYLAQKKYDEALKYFLLAKGEYELISNKPDLALLYSSLGFVYTKLGRLEQAQQYFDKAMSMAKELKSSLTYYNYYQGAELLDSAKGNWKNAYVNYKKYILLRDSIYSKDFTMKQISGQIKYENEKKTAAERAEREKNEIRQRLIRNSVSAGLAGTLIFLVVVYRQRNKISKEKRRSDDLLLNILPAETAEELKRTGTTKANDFELVTVMFTDFKNFTSLSAELSAQELVNEIHFCYSAFDNIIGKYGIEKIKTIGDSYMCASGLPKVDDLNPYKVIYAALEIKEFMLREKEKRNAEGRPFFEIRIGCHSGPVVAGIVGIKKFAYDIWGETVNIASRMESHGSPGQINISSKTYELVKDRFNCTARGKLDVKGLGEVEMYFVEGVRIKATNK